MSGEVRNMSKHIEHVRNEALMEQLRMLVEKGPISPSDFPTDFHGNFPGAPSYKLMNDLVEYGYACRNHDGNFVPTIAGASVYFICHYPNPKSK